MTKLITAVCLLRVFDGSLDKLDEDARQVIPRLKKMQIVTGVDGEGNPTLEETTKAITARYLHTHIYKP